ncbi:hypothetical protein M1446_03555 [Candidatus Dependentiae bacterium]|nr:hypothetical protein [Candidatus Dependentiae bacterium]
MFKTKFFVLASLICASTFAGESFTGKVKKTAKKNKVATVVAAGALTAGALTAYSLYLQKGDKEKSFFAKVKGTPSLYYSKFFKDSKLVKKADKVYGWVCKKFASKSKDKGSDEAAS